MDYHQPLRTCSTCSYDPDGRLDRRCYAHRRVAFLESLFKDAEEALWLYANPESYHGISIVADHAAPFHGDYGPTDHPRYSSKPGKRARRFYDDHAGLKAGQYPDWDPDDGPPDTLIDRTHSAHAEDCPNCTDEQNCVLHERIAEVSGALNDALATLTFYASPDTYADVQLMVDSPAGDFGEDIGEASGFRVEHDVPGETARETLRSIRERQGVWKERHEPSSETIDQQIQEKYWGMLQPSVKTDDDYFQDPLRSFRGNMWSGDYLILDRAEPTEKLTEDVRSILRDVFETEDLPHVHEQYEHNELYERTQAARERIADPDFSLPRIRAIIEHFGLDPDEHRADVLRLRCVAPGAHEHEEAKAAYTAHRDVWYANPASQYNCWIPVFDVSKDQAFEFYPRYFDRPVENDSDQFDYDEFDFQSDDGGVYPTIQQRLEDDETEAFALEAGQLLCFSPRHLHRTIENETDETRFSLDFRLVREDYNELDELNAAEDDKSSGDAAADYHEL